MFHSAEVFNKNLASWNTASVLNMYGVRSAQIARARARWSRRRLELSEQLGLRLSTFVRYAAASMACRGCARSMLMPRAPWRSRGFVRLAATLGRIAAVMLADVHLRDGLQPAPRKLEHGERFGHVLRAFRTTACARAWLRVSSSRAVGAGFDCIYAL